MFSQLNGGIVARRETIPVKSFFPDKQKKRQVFVPLDNTHRLGIKDRASDYVRRIARHIDKNIYGLTKGKGAAAAIKWLFVEKAKSRSIVSLDYSRAYDNASLYCIQRVEEKIGISNQFFPLYLLRGRPQKKLLQGMAESGPRFGLFQSEFIKKFREQIGQFISYVDDVRISLPSVEQGRQLEINYIRYLEEFNKQFNDGGLYLAKGDKKIRTYSSCEVVPFLGLLVTQNMILPEMNQSLFYYRQMLLNIWDLFQNEPKSKEKLLFRKFIWKIIDPIFLFRRTKKQKWDTIFHGFINLRKDCSRQVRISTISSEGRLNRNDIITLIQKLARYPNEHQIPLHPKFADVTSPKESAFPKARTYALYKAYQENCSHGETFQSMGLFCPIRAILPKKDIKLRIEIMQQAFASPIAISQKYEKWIKTIDEKRKVEFPIQQIEVSTSLDKAYYDPDEETKTAYQSLQNELSATFILFNPSSMLSQWCEHVDRKILCSADIETIDLLRDNQLTVINNLPYFEGLEFNLSSCSMPIEKIKQFLRADLFLKYLRLRFGKNQIRFNERLVLALGTLTFPRGKYDDIAEIFRMYKAKEICVETAVFRIGKLRTSNHEYKSNCQRSFVHNVSNQLESTSQQGRSNG